MIRRYCLILLAILLPALSACTSLQYDRSPAPGEQTHQKKTLKPTPLTASIVNGKRVLHCKNPQQFANRVIGDGHCVSLIKACSQAPITKYWREGPSIFDYPIQSGSVIATFKNGKYPNRHGWHAAVFIKFVEDGILVWDQWLGKAVHQRVIKSAPDAISSNDANRYRLVLLDLDHP